MVLRVDGVGLPRGDAAKLGVLCYPGSAAELLPMVLPRGEGLRRGVGRARTAVASTYRDERQGERR